MPSEESTPRYATRRETAAYLHKGVRTVDSWRRQGIIRALHPPGFRPVLFDLNEVDEVLRSGATDTPAGAA